MTASLPSEPALFGREGELISLSIATEPRLLEELLEALASLDFPGKSAALSPRGGSAGGVSGLFTAN